ncbi:CHAT domain-containing protein [Pseudanabaena sp. UWO311]|uniref:CHAT domain-containing protein n=1 Tax=Pseudanabaena sp. UWO311 TaxID=2487337 RepID=UPI00115B7BA9|nr:CHAT domain-containing protein [Pseudanabaena sp. UWO311]TYQ24099.1 CHAT domain-containing protein [Pseudanabaena sp. UWO311]
MRSSLKSLNCFTRLIAGGLLVTIGISLSPIQIFTFSPLKSVNAQSIYPREKEAEQLLKLGDEQYEKSQFQEALQTYGKALKIYQQNKDRKGLGNSQRKLGNIYNALGQYQKAIEYLEQALEIARQVDAQESEGRTLNNLGNTYSYLGQYQKAIEYYQQSIIITKQIGDLKGQVIAQGNLGSAYDLIGQYQKAIAHYQKSLDINRQIGYRSGEARALNNLGIVYNYLKQYQKAIEYYQQSLVIAKQIKNTIIEGEIINNLGNTLIALGQYQKAIEYYQQSLVIAKQIGDRNGEGRALTNLGYLFKKLDQIELAILFYKQSINVREEIRKDIRGLGIEAQKTYLSTIESSYRSLADLLLKQDRILEAQQVLDLLKVQELSDYLRTLRGNTQTAQGVDLQRPEQNIIALATELNTLQQKDRENKLSETEQQRLAQLVQTERDQNKQFNSFLNSPEIKKLIAELRRVEEQQNLNLSSYRKLQKDVLSQVPNAVLLYPLILDDHLELIIINAKTPPLRRTVKIKREQLNQEIVDFLSALRDAGSEDVNEPAKKLYKLLIQPFETELKELKIDTIIYAPDGQLRYIPLSALHDGKQWLVEKYRVNNITAESLTSFAPKPLAKPRIFAGAFGGKSGEKTRSGFEGLPATITEVQKIASLFPNTTTFTEAAFSKQITATKANSHTILHLATHGQLSVGTPEDSFILFGNGEKATIREIQDWSLSNVDLVILSACQSGLGSKLGTGVEILGLGYQMQSAGARVAIASLWKVNDAGTQALMTAFYGELQKGDITVTEALRRAQISLIRSSQYNHPNYWAAFFAIGNGL